MKEFQFALDGIELVDPSHLVHILSCGRTCLLCMHFFRGEIFFPLSVNLGVHMFGLWDQVAIVLPFQICHFFKGCCNWPNPKPYNKPCVLITFPGILVFVSNDPDLGTAFSGVCCFYWLSILVGSCFICRSWFLQGLITGCPALLSFL